MTLINVLVIEGDRTLRDYIENQLPLQILPKDITRMKATGDLTTARKKLFNPKNQFDIVICAETVRDRVAGKVVGNGLQLMRDFKPSSQGRGSRPSPLKIVMIDAVRKPESRLKFRYIPRETLGRARARTLHYLRVEISKYLQTIDDRWK